MMKNEIEKLVLEGQRLEKKHGLYLLNCPDLHWLGALADEVRWRLNPEPAVTYLIDRNINYSNICVTKCKFCAFYRSPSSEGGYLLSSEEIGRKIDEAKELGATSILMQGGQNPDLKIDYFENLFKYIKNTHTIHIHALSPSEIMYLARISGISLEETISRLKQAGLGSIPGGGAEILSDRVRQEISPLKNPVAEWLSVMRVAHKLELRTSATMMFGHIETLEERIDHLLALRKLQDETGGFTAFIPWTFQPANTELDEDRHYLHNQGVVDYLRTVAVSRLMLDNFPSVQVSWVTQGAKAAQIALAFGANDFGSTMIEENVVRSAGVKFSMSEKDIVRIVRETGLQAKRRNILYEILGDPLSN